jgi:HK97 family phage prohead protease
MLVGYAGVFHVPGDPGTEFEHPMGFVERFTPGAFDDIEKHDVVAGYNHDGNRVPLGRTPATLRLRSDSIGLRYEIDLPSTEFGREVSVAVERGDIRGSSLEFRPNPGGFTRFRDGDRSIREITSAEVRQVGPVDFPAFRGTSVSLRSEEQAEQEAWLQAEADAAAAIVQRQKALRAMRLQLIG